MVCPFPLSSPPVCVWGASPPLGVHGRGDGTTERGDKPGVPPPSPALQSPFLLPWGRGSVHLPPPPPPSTRDGSSPSGPGRLALRHEA